MPMKFKVDRVLELMNLLELMERDEVRRRQEADDAQLRGIEARDKVRRLIAREAGIPYSEIIEEVCRRIAARTKRTKRQTRPPYAS